jgi:ubiquitin carboxyl-terminal hydrolase 8
MQNGLQPSRYRNEEMSVFEIKERAKESVHKQARGASPMALIRTARTLSLVAQACELSGDLRGALSAFIKAGTLALMFMDTVEFKAESGSEKMGVLFKELQYFTRVGCVAYHEKRLLMMEQHEGNNWKQRVDGLVAKLEELDRSSSAPKCVKFVWASSIIC